jgi:hypothetical protein
VPKLKQRVRFKALGVKSLSDELAIPEPVFIGKQEAHRQLGYIEQYIRDQRCETIVIEDHYIDRDYMEDHSIFYSKNLSPYPNSCRRIHFFSLGPTILKLELSRLRGIGAEPASQPNQFRDECAKFSLDAYLGFCVIKPLPGCPVGRTVLQHFPNNPGTGFERVFDCCRPYESHLLGIPLTVHGLAFQQQDLGVSACATTALWSALQKATQMEAHELATPAQITMRASQYALPFGRPMPSEGLSLDQMSQAIHSLGHAPNLFRAEKFQWSRALLYSAVRSGIAPVLILSSRKRDSNHAVAVAGMKIIKPHQPSLIETAIDDVAGDLVALYIHDDRYGAYLKAHIRRRSDRLWLELPVGARSESWILTHVLVPMHSKIRLSFGELWQAGMAIVQYVHACRQSVLEVPPTVTSLESWIIRSHAYVESLISSPVRVPDSALQKLCAEIPLSRYLGIIRINAGDLDSIDVLLDSTSTLRNLNCLAIVRTGNSGAQTMEISTALADRYRCPIIG